MNSILGKITKIKELKKSTGSIGHTLEVSFKPACIMPSRKKIPEWIKDQELKVTRKVIDPREIGNAGDSIVLTPDEASSYLFPLEVKPIVTYGKLPKKIDIMLKWWKDKKPGEFAVKTNGRRKICKFNKKGKIFSASVDTDYFFDNNPTLPVDIEISFDKINVCSTVLPANGSYSKKLTAISGERRCIENEWYKIEICPYKSSGGISMLKEKARGIDYFKANENLIYEIFDQSGYTDIFNIGWNEKFGNVEMTCAGARHEGQAINLTMEGIVDKGMNINTSVSYSVFDKFPFILIKRDVYFKKPEQKDDKKGDKPPEEPVDQLMRVSLGCRAGFMVDKDRYLYSRILSVEKNRFAVIRNSFPERYLPNGWRLKEGWVIVEHPHQNQYMMYLFDKENAPNLNLFINNRIMCLLPTWSPQPVMPPDSIGFTVAFTTGEICGANIDGAWTAFRKPGSDGVECAIIGRFRKKNKKINAEIQIENKSIKILLQPMHISGIGEIYTAHAHLGKTNMKSKLDITVNGIPTRRLK